VDDLHLSEKDRGDTNLVKDGSFESEDGQLRIPAGTHEETRVVEGDAHSGKRALLIVSSGRGDVPWDFRHYDYPYNNVYYQVADPVLEGGKVYEVRFWAKWQRGDNRLLAQTPYSPDHPEQSLVQCTALSVPENIGSPGASNTVYRSNQGPVIGCVRQQPVLPHSKDRIYITCRIEDADGVSNARLFYRLDRCEEVFEVPLHDDGLRGDKRAGDGIWAGDIPPQSDNTVLGFWIQATDTRGEVGFFPQGDPDNPAVILVLNERVKTELPRYRLVQLTEDRERLRFRLPTANSLVPATFIYNDERIYYNVGVRHRGSRWDPPRYRPLGYRIRFNDDEKLHGVLQEINLDPQGYHGKGMLEEYTAYYLVRKLARCAPESVVPYSCQKYVRFWFYPQTGEGLVYADTQPVNKQYLSFWWAGDDQGALYKARPGANLEWTGSSKEQYRRFFKLRTVEKHDIYDKLIELCRFAKDTEPEDMPRLLPQRVDVDEWLVVLCVHRYALSWDTLGYSKLGGNAYLYFPATARRWYLIPWDLDSAFRVFDRHTVEKPINVINPESFPAMARMFHIPFYRRKVYRLYAKLLEGPADIEFIREYLYRLYSTFDGEVGWRPPDPSEILKFMEMRNEVVRERINAGTFKIRVPEGLFAALHGKEETVRATIEGDASAFVSDLQVNGESVMDRLLWTDVTSWSYTVDVGEGEHRLRFVALRSDGTEEGSAEVVIVYSRKPLPEISDFAPKEGPEDGGTEVVVRGRNFQEGAQIFFGEYKSPSVNFVSETELTCLSPEYTPGGSAQVRLKVVNPDFGSAVSTDTFFYIPLRPRVISVEPEEGKVSGGDTVLVRGERFQKGIRIFFGDSEAQQVVFVSPSVLRVRTPPGLLGPVDVRALNSDGRWSVCSWCFTYVPDPLVITAVDPPFGPVSGGNQVAVLGRNIVTDGEGISVIFGTEACVVVEADSERVLCMVPPGRPGPVRVGLTDGAGRTAALANGYTYTDQVPEALFVRGDANGDGRLTVSDARAVLSYLCGGSLSCKDAGDFNDDGRVDLGDAIELLEYLFAAGSPPEPPFPSPGPDLTEDKLTCKR